jgi:hypothetical protein
MRRVLFAVVAGFALLPLLVVSVACSDGGVGDSSGTPSANAVGTGTPLSTLNDRTKTQAPAATQYVNITGAVVTAVDNFDESSTGAIGNIYVQDLSDDPLPYSGITVYNPSFSPPDLQIAPSDVVDIRSLYQEFEGPTGMYFDPDCTPVPGVACGITLPELVGSTISFRFEYSMPPSRIVDVNDLYYANAAEYTKGRQWIGVYAELKDVTLWEDMQVDSVGRQTARFEMGGGKNVGALPRIGNALMPLDANQLKKGTKFASVKGIIQYFFSFSINPRSKDDLVPSQ